MSNGETEEDGPSKTGALSFWDVIATEKSLDDQIEVLLIKHENITEHLRDIEKVSQTFDCEEKFDCRIFRKDLDCRILRKYLD